MIETAKIFVKARIVSDLYVEVTVNVNDTELHYNIMSSDEIIDIVEDMLTNVVPIPDCIETWVGDLSTGRIIEFKGKPILTAVEIPTADAQELDADDVVKLIKSYFELAVKRLCRIILDIPVEEYSETIELNWDETLKKVKQEIEEELKENIDEKEVLKDLFMEE